MTEEYETFLIHYGVKGQKWGTRRYQNVDGTLTEEGKMRYGSKSDNPRSWKKKDVSKLSDEELNRRNLRMQREQQYIQSINNRKNGPLKTAKTKISAAAEKIFVASAVTALSAVMAVHYKKKLLESDFIKTRFPEYVEACSKKGK